MKRIEILKDYGVFIGSSIETELHKHHALELIVSNDKVITVSGSSGISILSKAVLIRPDEFHQTSTQGQATFIFIEPESQLAKKLIQTFANVDSVQDIEYKINDEELQWLCRGVIPESLSDTSTLSYTLDERIGKVADFIRLNITSNDISLETIAEVACLSSSRLVHLFKEQVGIPIRPFILWCRMRIAVSSVLSGMTLTQAAHEAGFSDASHLSRTFMEMFGINPSSVLK